VTAVPLLAVLIVAIPVPLSFRPERTSFMADGIFFGFGGVLRGRPHLLSMISCNALRRIALSIGFLPLAGLVHLYRCRAMPPGSIGRFPSSVKC
jgi:hypothetical protein